MPNPPPSDPVNAVPGRRSKSSRHCSVALLIFGLLFASLSARATTTTYTDSTAFGLALPGPSTTLDFEELAAGTLIPSGSTEQGITFTYAIDGLSLKVTDAFDPAAGSPPV